MWNFPRQNLLPRSYFWSQQSWWYQISCLEGIYTAVNIDQVLCFHFIFFPCLLLQKVPLNLFEQGFPVVTRLQCQSALLQGQTLPDRLLEFTLLFELTHSLIELLWLSKQRLQILLLMLKCFTRWAAADITDKVMFHFGLWLFILYVHMIFAFLFKWEEKFVVGFR